jgi:hypothetical protein
MTYYELSHWHGLEHGKKHTSADKGKDTRDDVNPLIVVGTASLDSKLKGWKMLACCRHEVLVDRQIDSLKQVYLIWVYHFG